MLSSDPNLSGDPRVTSLPRTTGRCPWPAGPLQPWPLANCLEEFLRGLWHPDQALASFSDHALVTEKVHCGIQTLAGCGMPPPPEGREESIATHRPVGLLQGGENIFDRLECRVGSWPCISRPGDFRGLCHDRHYIHPSSIFIHSSPSPGQANLCPLWPIPPAGQATGLKGFEPLVSRCSPA